MKIDLYTKGILTVIAFSLVVIAFKNITHVSKAFAHDGLNEKQVQRLIDNRERKFFTPMNWLWQEVDDRCLQDGDNGISCRN